MPQVIRSGGSTPPSKKSSNNSQGGLDSNKLVPVIAACVIAVLVLLYAGYATFFVQKSRPAVTAEDKSGPPPGYPDRFPYNDKRWQQGKMLGGGFPLPPSLGGKPPN
jgi:hypothetical protein